MWVVVMMVAPGDIEDDDPDNVDEREGVNIYSGTCLD